jgi:serine/threonine-protein kinase
VEREIGRGGTAIVYVARDLKHDRDVALKVLLPQVGVSLGAERFQREIQIAAKLAHPHILPLYDSGVAGSFIYFVMPFVDGESLRDRLAPGGPLPVDEAIEIATAVADALGYAHEQGIVHRDIKPGNILLEAGHAVVADFGIARAIAETGTDRITHAGIAVGTPAYMSPEQATGGTELDGRSDIYSLGCVLYEMLSGEPPFTGSTPQAVLAQHATEKPRRLDITGPGVSAQLAQTVRRALEKDPADRFQTAEGFKEALQGGVPVRRFDFLRPWQRIAVAVVILAAFSVGVDRLLTEPPRYTFSPATTFDPNQIAVLPLEDRSASQELDQLGLVLTDELIDALQSVEGLGVQSSAATRPFVVTPLAPDSIARALRVGTLVTGYVEESGDRLRVAVSLVEAETGRLIGETARSSAPRNRADSLRIGVRDQLARELRRSLGDHVTRTRWRIEPGNAAAWTLLELAEDRADLAEQAQLTGELLSAVRLLRMADSLATDAQEAAPRWVEPTLLRGWLRHTLAEISEAAHARQETMPEGFGQVDVGTTEGWRQEGIDLASAALRLAPAHARGFELRGALRLLLWYHTGGEVQDSLFVAAERDLARAVAVAPPLPKAWHHWSLLHRFKGQPEEAALAARQAIAADVYLADDRQHLSRHFFGLLQRGEVDEAGVVCQNGRALYPDQGTFRHCHLTILSLSASGSSAIQEAWDELAALEDSEPAGSVLWGYGRLWVAAVLARSGARDSAFAVIQGTRETVTAEDVQRSLDAEEAFVWVLLGDPDAAIGLLERHVTARPQDRSAIAADPRFHGFRDDARFRRVFGSAAGQPSLD